LNTAIELGITGLIIFMIIVVIIMKDFITTMRTDMPDDRKLILAGIFSSLVGFFSLNLFDYMYYGWPGQMFWMLTGIGYALMMPGFGIKNYVHQNHMRS